MRADARRNYDLLVATAGEVFAEQGLDAPLDDIAKRAGVGPGTLYRHFPRREALVEAVYRDEIQRLADLAGELLATRDPFAALAEWLASQIRSVARKNGMLGLLKASVNHQSEVFDECHLLMRGAARQLLEAARADGTVRADIEPGDLLRLAHGVATAGETATLDARTRLLAVVLDGLAP